MKFRFPKTLLTYFDADGQTHIVAETDDPKRLEGRVLPGTRIGRFSFMGVATFQTNPTLLAESDGD